MSDAVDVAIVGAGPYGLSVAAHLSAAGLSFRQFGLPMRLWREAMPKGMYLKSQGFASNLSDPEGSHTLEAFCKKTSHPYPATGCRCRWRCSSTTASGSPTSSCPAWKQVLVSDVARRAGGFDVSLADGQVVRAANVVVAAGVEHFARMPQMFGDLPEEVCTHASEHTDLGRFSGQRVAVIGAGQSALESAALLHESGADVELIARKDIVRWNGKPLDPDRPLLQRMREPEAGLGSGWSTWFYSRHPELFRLLPERTRIYRARTALGPAGASWLRTRVEGQFPLRTGHAIQSATAPSGGGVRLGLVTRDGSRSEVAADHVIAATGYRPDLTRFQFIGSQLRSALTTVDESIAVGRNYQSAVPGLYVVGPAVAPTMGPVMRFVYGSDHAAHYRRPGAGWLCAYPVPVGCAR